MKKLILVIVCMSVLCLVGCVSEQLNSEKLRDIEFTVVSENKIPKELKEMMDEKEGKPFKLTYADNGIMYIAVGYGEQSTNGYSIEVKELYETKNAVYIHTDLIGPSKDEKVVERKSYPYIVVKAEFVDKKVVFE